MKLLMTPKFHCLLRHTLRQLEATTGGGLGDLGEDGIERSHQERLKDNRMNGLRDFRRRTDSQAKMQFIRTWMLSRFAAGSS
jgi:hypothetical protein